MTQPNQTSAVVDKRAVAALLNSDKFKTEVKRVLPQHITPERLIRVALTAANKNPAILQCTQESLFGSILVCAQAGLEPDGRLAHLIPYGKVCQVIFDWKGLVTLALRNNYSVYPDMVCENDQFEAWNENGERKLLHKVDWRKPRGEPILFYCTAVRNGILDYEIMTVEECDKIRERSRAGKSGPWVTDTNEMRKKCPIRRMSKRWDMLPEISAAINADDDTPPPLGSATEIEISRPIFKEPKEAKVDKVEVNENESPQPDAPEDSFDAAQPYDPTAEIRTKLKETGVSEVEFCSRLVELGVTGAETLNGLALEPEALTAAEKSASDIIAKIKKGQKK